MKKTLIALILTTFLLTGPAFAAPEPAPPLAAIPSFSPIVEKAAPAVVNISATKIRENQQRPNPFGSQENPFGGDLFDRFFGHPAPQQNRKEHSLGSGFIFDPAGYIITNNHVVEGAEDIKVKLTSGEEIEAEIVGRDAKTDLALLKLKDEKTYPYLNLGNSSASKIGDWLVAIGNPFGLEHTVTAGILSARSRSIGAGPYDDFLQTDASINPGNSGGPLLNLAGEVIGINTAIVAGGTGIGFAIPANLAKGIVEQLKDDGRVVRGWIGVVIQKVTPELAKSYGLKEAHGALVGDVDPDGPSAKAKVERGDIILEFDGQKVEDWNDLPIIVASTPVGKKVKMVVWRNKKEVTLNLTLGELKEDETEGGSVGSSNDSGKLGLTLRTITPEVADRFNFTETEGLYVASIEPDSPASESGLRTGDILLEIDNQEVENMSEYRKVISKKDEGDIVRFLVRRGANTMFFTVTVPE